MRTANYSTYLSRVAGLIGVAVADMQSEETFILNGFFNHAIKDAWESSNWIDLTMSGEARLIGNLVPYANAYTAYGSSWGTSALTVTDNVLANPADSRATAATLIETAAVSGHQLQTPTITVLPAAQYVFSAYLRPYGRSFVRLQVADTSSYSAFFSLTGAGAVVSESGCTASIGQVSNGFYLCSITYTSSATSPVSSVASVALSTDGSTTIYAGNTMLGVGAWGYYLGPSLNTGQALTLPWDQTGETFIEAIFNVWNRLPSSVTYAAPIPYTFSPAGVTLVGTGSAISPGSPVFVDYRQPVPDYEGATFAALSTYAINDQVYFTDSDGVGNYWKCVAVTSAGESPSTTPAKWALIEIPQLFLDFTVYNAYAQWLRVEGRNGAAEIAESRAEEELNDEFDRQERQMGAVLPTKYQTHVSAQSR